MRLSPVVILLFSALSVAMLSCHRIDDDRLPPAPVNIVFNEGQWAVYGVAGPTDTQRFVRTLSMTEPAGFPYTASTYTGFGGVLLAVDYNNNPVAYDLSCPFEARADIRVAVDRQHLDARCPECGSTYDIFGGYGRPLSGPSAERGYGLTRYRVLEGDALNYRIITR